MTSDAQPYVCSWPAEIHARTTNLTTAKGKLTRNLRRNRILDIAEEEVDATVLESILKANFKSWKGRRGNCASEFTKFLLSRPCLRETE